MDDGERVEQSHGFGRCVGSVGTPRCVRGVVIARSFVVFGRGED